MRFMSPLHVHNDEPLERHQVLLTKTRATIENLIYESYKHNIWSSSIWLVPSLMKIKTMYIHVLVFCWYHSS